MMDGHEGLREELARYFGIPSGADERPARGCILTTAGSSNAIMIALAAIRRLLLRHGAGTPHAIVESPTYRPLFDVAEYLGFETSSFRRNAADGYRLRLTPFARRCRTPPARRSRPVQPSQPDQRRGHRRRDPRAAGSPPGGLVRARR